MPRYSYTARGRSGEVASATAEVESLPALAAGLVEQGSEILTAREVREDLPHIRVPIFEITALYRHVATSLEAGLPTVEALDMLSAESRSSRLKSLVHFLSSRLKAGEPLSGAMALFPDTFPRSHVAVARAGEESGRLEKALADLADQADGVAEMNRRFSSALVYPAVVAVVALLVFNFGFFAIVPKFRVLFGDLGIVEFSTITQLVFFLAGSLLPVIALLAVGGAILITLISIQRKAARGGLWLDNWKLRFPVLGQIVEKAALSRFTGMLGLLLDAGVDLPRAVDLAAGGAGNAVAEQALRNVAVEVERGTRRGNRRASRLAARDERALRGAVRTACCFRGRAAGAGLDYHHRQWRGAAGGGHVPAVDGSRQ